MTTITHPAQAVEIIKPKLKSLVPQVGMILGSGLGSVAESMQDPIIIPYTDLPGFPNCQVAGHAGKLIIGKINGLPVACLSGRAHVYETGNAVALKIMIRTLKLLGCHTLLTTNAAGSLHPDVGPGSLMLINDHINLSFNNPLVGMNDDEFGPRFTAMEDAYDPELRRDLLTIAQELKIQLGQGIYIGVLGPCFETPAEIRAFRALGADLVGMSTVPEVIVARHCGLRVVSISVVTNLAAGMSDEHLSHGGTLHYSANAVDRLTKLIIAFMGQQNNAN